MKAIFTILVITILAIVGILFGFSKLNGTSMAETVKDTGSMISGIAKLFQKTEPVEQTQEPTFGVSNSTDYSPTPVAARPVSEPQPSIISRPEPVVEPEQQPTSIVGAILNKSEDQSITGAVGEAILAKKAPKVLEGIREVRSNDGTLLEKAPGILGSILESREEQASVAVGNDSNINISNERPILKKGVELLGGILENRSGSTTDNMPSNPHYDPNQNVPKQTILDKAPGLLDALFKDSNSDTTNTETKEEQGIGGFIFKQILDSRNK